MNARIENRDVQIEALPGELRQLHSERETAPAEERAAIEPEIREAANKEVLNDKESRCLDLAPFRRSHREFTRCVWRRALG